MDNFTFGPNTIPSNTIIVQLSLSTFISLVAELLISLALLRAPRHSSAASCADMFAYSPSNTGTALLSSTPVTAAGSSLAIKSA